MLSILCTVYDPVIQHLNINLPSTSPLFLSFKNIAKFVFESLTEPGALEVAKPPRV